MMEFVNGKDDIPSIMGKKVPNHQPDGHYLMVTIMVLQPKKHGKIHVWNHQPASHGQSAVVHEEFS